MKNTFLAFCIFISITIPQAVNASEAPPIDFQVEAPHWEEVEKALPRKSIFTVIDIESGKSFVVQRRAGSHHADVQPLTVKDTAIMKDIYGGKWSWRRRAILIMTPSRLIAGSMHGMPHGAGALPNNFPGHFCIHFTGSTTHSTERSDLAHQVMILKAAGRFDEFIASLPPSELMNVFMVAIKNADKGLTRKIAVSNKKDLNKKLNEFKKLENIQWEVLSHAKASETALYASVPVKVKILSEENGSSSTVISFTLIRTSPISPWKVNIDPLLEQVAG
ncbi:hypothetical protein [Falsibacillus pallidus]|uniref:Uncharacterized protein n=1 Tax=Falsibacillus pallidus TaxID=493781 RepID=A0A370GQA1_9BACI|nr:hypothetical protein [Falsibacillus pallidus]RDI45892.1 hypothetical protein DFR59_102527 [Falsibacillus pallidus]